MNYNKWAKALIISGLVSFGYLNSAKISEYTNHIVRKPSQIAELIEKSTQEIWSSNSKQHLSMNDYKSNIQFVILESRIVQNNRILADLMTTQAILESNLLGRPSKLALNDNNLFGIKCRQGSRYRTSEHIKGQNIRIFDTFCHYSSIKEGFKARNAMFDKKRYKNLYTVKSFEEAAYMIKADGYATDPTYPKQLIAIYKKYIKGVK